MKTATLSIIACCAALSVSAADPFSEIEQRILANSYGLAASASQAEATSMTESTDNNLTDPEIEFEHLWGKGSVKWGAGISQSFDWPALYSARSKALRASTDARRLMLESDRADLIYKSRQLMLDIVGIRRQIQVSDSMISNLERLLSTTRLAMERNQATRLDVSKAEFALLSLRREREDYVIQLDDSRSSLTAMNGGNPVDISGLDNYPAAQLLTADAYIEAFDNNAPGAAAAKARTLAAAADARVARLASFPSFTVGYRHAYEEQTHYNGFSVAMTLPFFSSRNKHNAAQAQMIADRIGADGYILEQHAEIMAAHARAHRMQSRLADFDKVFGNCDYTAILNRLYENGQINVIDYINEINYYLGIRREYLQLQNDYHLTLAALNRYI